MARSRKVVCGDGCNGCNVMNAALIVPVHKMTEKDLRRWASIIGAQTLATYFERNVTGRLCLWLSRRSRLHKKAKSNS